MLSFLPFFLFIFELLMNPPHLLNLCDLLFLLTLSSITRHRTYESIPCFLFVISVVIP